MATFEHRRYQALTLQDAEGIWAQFTEEARSFGEHTVRVGILRTDDAALIKRLRAASDPDLVEVGADESTDPDEPETPADEATPAPRAARRRA